MTELEHIEQLQEVQIDPDIVIPEIVQQLVKDITPTTSPITPLNPPAAEDPVTATTPPLESPGADVEISSHASNQLISFVVGLESPVRSPVIEPKVTNDQLRLAINNLFGMLQRSNMSSQDALKVVSSSTTDYATRNQPYA